ncbi:hypothetical protein [uncultured Shewanella sp.]|nr:hypothetical protein [uncultured Shewanella sp.]
MKKCIANILFTAVAVFAVSTPSIADDNQPEEGTGLPFVKW